MEWTGTDHNSHSLHHKTIRAGPRKELWSCGEGVFKIWLNLSLSDSIGRFGVISLFKQSQLCLLPVTMIDEHALPDFCLKHSRLLLYFLLPNLTGGVSE